MTAQPVGDLAWSPDPRKQKRAGYTVEDVLDLPDDAPRVELTDGVLNVVPSPSGGHQRINVRLVSWLERHLPDSFESLMAVGVLVDVDTTREPDAVIVHRPFDLDHHFCKAEQVLVAVEIAGIPHYWRIEQNPVHVFAYDLVGGRYELVADSAQELVLDKPFELTLPIRDIAP